MDNLKWVTREENIVKTDSILPLTEDVNNSISDSDEDVNNSINDMVGTIDSVEELLLWIYTQDKHKETILYHNDSVIDKFRKLSLIEYFGADITINKFAMFLSNIYRYILILMYNQKYGVTLTAILDSDTRDIIDYLISRYKKDIPLLNTEYEYLCKKILFLLKSKDNI